MSRQNGGSGGGVGRRSNPDHGENFVPGSETAPNLAPQPLDHFKRGYRERADQRDRETSMLNGDFRRRSSSSGEPQPPSQQDRDRDGRDRPSGGGGNGGGSYPPPSSHSNGNKQPEQQAPTPPKQHAQSQSQSQPPPSQHHQQHQNQDRPRHQHHHTHTHSSHPPPHRSSFNEERRSSYNESRSSFNESGHRHSHSTRDSNVSATRDSYYDQRRSSFNSTSGGGSGGGGGDRGDDRGRGQVIMGLDVQALVDRLCRQGTDVFRELDETREEHLAVFSSGKAVTAIISNLARRRNLRLASIVWDWIDSVGIKKNTFHYNSMISVCEKVRDYNKALRLLDEMREKGVAKNEVTFSSAISACEKCGQWRTALDLLDQMKKEGAGQTAIAYNAAISACEKGLVPHKALEIFEQMKREGVRPTVVTYSALISAAEKGQQWKLALEVLEEMKAAGHGANVIAYSAAISALSKGQMWHKALELFREIEASGGKPSIVTYNATMTALEKGLQWERALDLFDEMKMKNMPVTVVSYGSAISACEKGLQYRQCLEYLDEMTEMGIKKNVIIFGAAMSCMEKSCRADIAFQLMERMKLEDVAPNVHIYNSAISACARCNLWEKGYELFKEMDEVGVPRDVVTYNAVLDAVCSQVELGRKLFKEGVEKGFYARVSRLGTQWLELDLHFLSLGGGEIALGWWFEECLVPYLVNTSKLEAVQSISIVTGYGKTRSRGARMNDDGMRLRVRAMLKYMNIKETPQPNKGRIHINKAELIDEVKRNNGKILFDLPGYTRFKEEETTANKFPDVPQKVRARFRPARPGEGPPGTFIREGGEDIPVPPSFSQEELESRREQTPRQSSSYQPERRDSRRSSAYMGDDRGHNLSRGNDLWQDKRGGGVGDKKLDQRAGYDDDWRGGQDRVGSYGEPSKGNYGEPSKGSYAEPYKGSCGEPSKGSYNEPSKGAYGEPSNGSYEQSKGAYGEHSKRASYNRDQDSRGFGDYQDRRTSYNERTDNRGGYGDNERRSRHVEGVDRRGSSNRDWDRKSNFDRRPTNYDRDRYEDRGLDSRTDSTRRYEDRDQKPRSSFQRPSNRDSYYGDDRHGFDDDFGRFHRGSRDVDMQDRRPADRSSGRDEFGDSRNSGNVGFSDYRLDQADDVEPRRESSTSNYVEAKGKDAPRQKRVSDSAMYQPRKGTDLNDAKVFDAIKEDPDPWNQDQDDAFGQNKKRSFEDYQKQQPNRGYNIEPAYSKRRSV